MYIHLTPQSFPVQPYIYFTTTLYNKLYMNTYVYYRNINTWVTYN